MAEWRAECLLPLLLAEDLLMGSLQWMHHLTPLQSVVEHGLVVFGYIYSVSACTREHCRRQLGVGQAVEDALEGVTGGDDGGRHGAVGG